MAELLGIKRVRFEWAVNEKIISRPEDGRYHPEVVVPQWVEFERSLAAKGEGRSELAHERVRLTKAKADAAELRLAQVNRSLLSTNDIIEVTRTVCLRIRNKLVGFVPKIARACYSAPSPKEATLAARREVDTVLGELSALKPDRRRGKLEIVRT